MEVPEYLDLDEIDFSDDISVSMSLLFFCLGLMKNIIVVVVVLLLEEYLHLCLTISVQLQESCKVISSECVSLGL